MTAWVGLTNAHGPEDVVVSTPTGSRTSVGLPRRPDRDAQGRVRLPSDVVCLQPGPDQASPANLLAHVRGHWTAEALHWVRGVVFGEKVCRAYRECMTTIRNTAITLLGVTSLAGRQPPVRAAPS